MIIASAKQLLGSKEPLYEKHLLLIFPQFPALHCSIPQLPQSLFIQENSLNGCWLYRRSMKSTTFSSYISFWHILCMPGTRRIEE